jgi:hypothetical protein
MRIRMRGWLSAEVAIINGVPWTRAKARKVWTCAHCRGRIAKGQQMWRPVSHRHGTRLCSECVGTPEPPKGTAELE